MKLSELEEGSKLSLRIISSEKRVNIDTILKKHVRDNIALITLICDSDQKINFDNLRTDIEFTP